MSIGFGGNQNAGRTGKDAEITIDLDEIDVLIKKYKGLKKYAKFKFVCCENDGWE